MKAVSGIIVALFLLSIFGVFNSAPAVGQEYYSVYVKAAEEENTLNVDINWKNTTMGDTNTTTFLLDSQLGELNLSAPQTWTVGYTSYLFKNWTVVNDTDRYSFMQNNVTLNVAGDTQATAYYTISEISVDIDIKPGSDPNSINRKSKGMLPIAILGHSDLDVTQIDPTTINTNGVTLATRAPKRKNKPPKLEFSYEDVNGDGILDMVVFFKVQDLEKAGLLAPGTTQLTLTGALNDGTPITGTDSVRIVPPQKT